jgi:hypothetical protein
MNDQWFYLRAWARKRKERKLLEKKKEYSETSSFDTGEEAWSEDNGSL